MLSLILPVFNEEYNLSTNFNKIYKEASKASTNFEIIIAEDGSTDGTYELARTLSRNHPNVKLSHSPERIGKGLAIKRAFSIAAGDTAAYMDIDLSSDIASMGTMLLQLEEYEIVIGSRLRKRDCAERKLIRYLLSVSYNLLIRILFRSRIRDHQCGMKFFRSNVFRDLVSKSRSERWFFDTELLLLAQKKRLRIKEYPVPWKESENSKVRTNLVVLQMLKEIAHSMFSRQE